jgi:hypothetical protein
MKKSILGKGLDRDKMLQKAGEVLSEQSDEVVIDFPR